MGGTVTGEALFWKRFVERFDKPAKRVGAMTDAMLQLRIELAEGLFVADGDEHRVVTEAPISPRRPDENPVDAPIEGLGLAVVGPGDRKRAGKMRRGRRVRLGRLDLAPDLVHRPHLVSI